MGRNTSAPGRRIIQSPGLFGDAAPLLELIHCETIEARSALHAWELAPHQHARLHQLLFVERGAGTAHLDGTAHPLSDQTLVSVAPGHVHAFSFRAGTRGVVLSLSVEFLDGLFAADRDALRAFAQPRVMQAHERAAALVGEIAGAYAHQPGHAGRGLVLRGLCAALLGQLLGDLDDARPAAARGEHRLMQQFDRLLESHYLEHWGVARYARALAVTPTRLGRVARASRGHPPSRLIAERLVREARRRLAYTGLGVAEIAYGLGYADPAYFSRVFTRCTGCSPRQWRERAAS